MFLVKYAVAWILPTGAVMVSVPEPVQENPRRVYQQAQIRKDKPKVRIAVARPGERVAVLNQKYFVKDIDGEPIPLDEILDEFEEDDEEDWYIGEEAPKSAPIPVPRPKRIYQNGAL